VAKGGKGLLMLLGGPKGKAEDDDLDMDDDYSEDVEEDEGSDLPAGFSAHAEEALGSADPAKHRALYEAIKSCHEE
jgi:hypothetical protein